jgi:hypothetical protein|tara:strand:+ start:4104 stop:4517 length:414 start_codon:yes stop_codon:yes gene_type:complete
MIRTIFKITLPDDTIYYTTSRNDVVNKINDFNKDDGRFKKYTIGTINGVLYNNQKKVRGVKDVERFNVRDFYKEYIDTYTDKIHNNSNGKIYNEHSIKRLQNHFIAFINMEILTAKNSGETDDNIKQHINKVAMLTC